MDQMRFSNEDLEDFILYYISENIEYNFSEDDVLQINAYFVQNTDSFIFKNICNFWHLGQSVSLTGYTKNEWFVFEKRVSLFLNRVCKNTLLYDQIKDVLYNEVNSLKIFSNAIDKFTMYYILLLLFYYGFNRNIYEYLILPKMKMDLSMWFKFHDEISIEFYMIQEEGGQNE